MMTVSHAKPCSNPEAKIRRFAACPFCKSKYLVKHICDATNQRPVLYESASKYRAMVDTTRPHICKVAPTFDEVPAPSTPNPEGVVIPNVDEIVAKVIDKMPKVESVSLDMNDEATQSALRGLVQKAVEERLTKPSIIDVRSESKVTRIEGAHRQFNEVLYWCSTRDINGFRFSPFLSGKPGISKSHTSRQVAEALGLTFDGIPLNPGTPPSALFGYNHVGGGYVSTPFRKAYEEGGLYLIDEIDNGSDATLTSLNTALANGFCSFPDRLVVRHPDFVCIATGNTAGRGGSANHAGRRPLDGATLDRFAFIDWQIDPELELRLALAANADNGAIWLTWIRKVRDYCATHHPRIIVSPRATMMGATALGDSPFTMTQIADMSLFKGIEADTRAKVLAACPLPYIHGR